jgi:hypothetical protein
MRKAFKFKHLAAAILIVALAQLALSCKSSKLSGLWRLVSYVIEIQSTGEIVPAMGKNPTGYVLFTQEGRAFFILTGDGRNPAKTDQERAELLKTLVSYTGLYRIEGDQWITKIDVAWNPEWIGTEQRRNFKIEGNRLQVLTPWRMMPNWADKGMSRSIITFERAD